MEKSLFNNKLPVYLLETAIEQSPDGIIIAEATEGTIILANSAALKIRGETDLPLKNIPFSKHQTNWNLFYPDTTPYDYNDLPLTRAIIYGEQSQNVHMIVHTDKGEEKWISVNSSPVKDPSGKIIAGIAVLQEITARKETEKRILWFSRMLDQIGEGVLLANKEGYITYINSAGAKMHGYEPDELTGKNHAIFHTEQQMRNIMPAFLNKVWEQGYCTDELEDVRKDGSVFPVKVTATKYYDEFNNPAGLIAIATDITAQKQYETELKREKEFISAIFKYSFDGIAVADKKGNIKAFSPGMEKIFGVKFSDIKNMNQLADKILKTAKEKEYMFNLWNTDINSKNPPERTMQFTRNDGSKRYCRLQLSRMNDDEFVINGQDITESKELEHKLQTERDRSQKYLDISGVLIVILTADQKVSVINKKGCEILGYSEEEILGRNWFDTFLPDRIRENTRNEFKKYIRMTADTDIKFFENPILTKSGEEKTILWKNTVLLDENGKPCGTLSSGSDITELRKVTQQLAQKVEELERSNYELEQYAYVASHDLQEPVRNLIKYLQLIKVENKDIFNSKSDTFMQRAIINAERMSKLIKSLLALSQIDRHKLEFKRVSVIKLIQELLNDNRLIIRENNATVTYDNLPDITADPTYISQLFQNLIINAIKFKSDKNPHIHIGAQKTENEWVFSVSDNGIGIEESYLNKIFLMFERLDKTNNVDGLGIGLALCKRVVEHHNGRIWAQSQPGKGTVFFFTIPDTQ